MESFWFLVFGFLYSHNFLSTLGFTNITLRMNFFQNNELVDSQTIGHFLDEIISPRFYKRGLIWNGKNLWFDQPKNSVRKVFKYSKLKGEQGTFEWGICLDFVPTISSRKLKFHRTDKSVVQHLFEWTDEYSNSFYGGQLDGGITTHWGKLATQKSIKHLLDKYEQKINNWFDGALTIDNLTGIAEQQIFTGKSYNLHSPDQRMVLAFLQAKKNQLNEATRTIKQLTIDESLKELLLKQLGKLG